MCAHESAASSAQSGPVGWHRIVAQKTRSTSTVGAILPMALSSPFYSDLEVRKPEGNRVHHNNTVCPSGRDIAEAERRPGAGGYRLCTDCAELNRQGH